VIWAESNTLSNGVAEATSVTNGIAAGLSLASHAQDGGIASISKSAGAATSHSTQTSAKKQSDDGYFSTPAVTTGDKGSREQLAPHISGSFGPLMWEIGELFYF